jgi:hypothetical protein
VGLEHLPHALTAGAGRVDRAPRGPHGRVDRRAAPTATELEELIRRSGGNMMQVARTLDRKPAVIYRWARRFKLDIESIRHSAEPPEDGGIEEDPTGITDS